MVHPVSHVQRLTYSQPICETALADRAKVCKCVCRINRKAYRAEVLHEGGGLVSQLEKSCEGPSLWLGKNIVVKTSMLSDPLLKASMLSDPLLVGGHVIVVDSQTLEGINVQ